MNSYHFVSYEIIKILYHLYKIFRYSLCSKYIQIWTGKIQTILKKEAASGERNMERARSRGSGKGGVSNLPVEFYFFKNYC